MRTLIRFSIIVLFLVLGLQAVTAQTSPTRLRLKQLELAPDSTEHVITSDTNRVAVWTKMESILFVKHSMTIKVTFALNVQSIIGDLVAVLSVVLTKKNMTEVKS